MHSFSLFTTVFTILAFALATSLSSAAPLSQLDPPAFILDLDELTGGGSIRIHDRVVKFVGEDVIESVGISIPVVGEKAVRKLRRHAKGSADVDDDTLITTAVGQAQKVGASLAQAVEAELRPAVKATVQTVSPPAADLVAEAASAVEGALDLIV